ncbi:hypothetical protein [Halopseudomonas maritima]|uniref:hypothetical protein n=1 Tax=Halopseudomonas maritima TaxID=2918528 RepID=UPI001EEB8574|nr:hypothetical protein [Halopseudomonas maritima]UJJ31087.1 hypothetical protein HV822_15165 [Halopseudomonas maritima]
MNIIKKSIIKLCWAARLSIIPSLSAGAILVLGTIAATQYSDFSNYILNFWQEPYFSDPELMYNTASWLLKITILGFMFSIFILIHARVQEVALAKFREIDDTA